MHHARRPGNLPEAVRCSTTSFNVRLAIGRYLARPSMRGTLGAYGDSEASRGEASARFLFVRAAMYPNALIPAVSERLNRAKVLGGLEMPARLVVLAVDSAVPLDRRFVVNLVDVVRRSPERLRMAGEAVPQTPSFRSLAWKLFTVPAHGRSGVDGRSTSGRQKSGIPSSGQRLRQCSVAGRSRGNRVTTIALGIAAVAAILASIAMAP